MPQGISNIEEVTIQQAIRKNEENEFKKKKKQNTAYQKNYGAQEGTNCSITSRQNRTTHQIFTHQQNSWCHDSMTEVRAWKYHGPKSQQKQSLQGRPAAFICMHSK